MDIPRVSPLPSKSFFLLGPRGTGKSTLIRKAIPFQLEINLLKSNQFLPLTQNPSLLHEKIKDLPPGSWVFIDEVQKIPALLDEVHAAYEDKRIHFALSGSSARKLKRGNANLLAGRALNAQLFPLVKNEYQERMSFKDALEWGTLPLIVTDIENRKETLSAYVETYLRQELMEEGLIRSLDPFARFLNVAGTYNAQTLNVENIAREAHLGRSTVDKYFDVLEDTLIGFRLQPLQAKIHRKEVIHPKFYLFDCGVARACAGLLDEELDPSWLGFALETYLLHEVRAYNSYFKKNRTLFYYRYSGGYEIDLLIETKKKTLSSPGELVLIEIKAAKKWDRRWNVPLEDFKASSKRQIKATFGVYLGSEKLQFGDVQVFPLPIFLELLYLGKIF